MEAAVTSTDSLLPRITALDAAWRVLPIGWRDYRIDILVGQLRDHATGAFPFDAPRCRRLLGEIDAGGGSRDFPELGAVVRTARAVVRDVGP